MMEEGYKIIDNVIYTPELKDHPDGRGIGWVYYESMLKHKNRVAQIDGLTGETDSFGALLLRCVRTAIGLKAKGVRYGDVVSVCTKNHLNSCVPHISSMFVGAKIAALDPSMTVRDAAHLFKIVMPKLIFVEEESVALIEDVIKEVGATTTIVVFGSTDKHESFLEFAKPTSEEQTFRPVLAEDIKDVAVIMFSSGTSGFPKGVCHTHFSILRTSSNAMLIGSYSGITYASDSPYWNVFLFYLNHSLQSGSSRLVHPKFDLKNPWTIFRHQITTAFLNVTELMTLCNTPKPHHIDTSSLKLITTAGGPVTVQQIQKGRSCFPNTCVRINYGQSEVFQSATSFDPSIPNHIELMKRKPNSSGLPKRGITYRFVDIHTGETLGPNQRGELRVKTEAQLSGYYNMDSSKVWDEDGWLRTGDYGYYDEDCCFYIIDRVKEMFKYQYWHIVPAVIESVLASHPAVYKAVVLGKPHEVDEHHPMAIIQLKQQANVTEDEIVKYVEDKVEERQRLRGGVVFVQELPLTPSRKINRWKLKQMILQGEL